MKSEGIGFRLGWKVVKFLAILAMVLPVMLAPAQGLMGGRRTEAPVQLFISGAGSVTPLKNGQLVSTVAMHSMTANPAKGQKFLGWARVNVFIYYDTTVDESGNSVVSTNTVLSPIPGSIQNRTLVFGVTQPVVIFDVPGVRTIVRSSGWQANFTGSETSDGSNGLF